MNAEHEESTEDESSRSEESSSQPTSQPTVSELSNSDSSLKFGKSADAKDSKLNIKRDLAKKLIEKYYFQLIKGCGDTNCKNVNCASRCGFEQLTPNKAAARAIQLCKEKAEICGSAQPPKIAKETIYINQKASTSTFKYVGGEIGNCLSRNSEYEFIDEQMLNSMIRDYKLKIPNKLIRAFICGFSSIEALSLSFIKPSPDTDETTMKKEDLRTLQGETDKDVDSCAFVAADVPEYNINGFTNVDIPSVRRVFGTVFGLKCDILNKAIDEALRYLYDLINLEIRHYKQPASFEKAIHCFVILSEIICLKGMNFETSDVAKFYLGISWLPDWGQARLAKIWAQHCKLSMPKMVFCVQEIISSEVLTNYHDYKPNLRFASVQNNSYIIAATQVLKILLYSSIIAGSTDPPGSNNRDYVTIKNPNNDPQNVFPDNIILKSRPIKENGLPKLLGVSIIDSRTPFIEFEEFYNTLLNEVIEMDSDYLNYRKYPWNKVEKTDNFSFMEFPFILTPATKVLALYYDCRIKMYTERQTQMMCQIMNNSDVPASPYLKLKVRRENIIYDALIELELIALNHPKDFRKQLVVEFIGEQGVDAGGISKEFFQLVIQEIFNPDNGMFVFNEETHAAWFNHASFENEAEYILIGIIIGLAIYNNIILPINFPMVVYRKLLDGHGTFDDMEDFDPILYKNFKKMLNYSPDDMEDVFCQSFLICYKDIFGIVMEHELKPQGGDILVSQSNKHEFIAMYCDFLLNKIMEKQFNAFKKGFLLVTGDTPLRLLFRPEEIEKVICGSCDFNFKDLERSTKYEGGYTANSRIIIDFWSVLHEMPLESKKKFLEFTTGSDRTPVGGLSHLKLVISRSDDETNTLPTSHTCFNVLHLPNYETKEKLKQCLMIAITYSQGFGLT